MRCEASLSWSAKPFDILGSGQRRGADVAQVALLSQATHLPITPPPLRASITQKVKFCDRSTPWRPGQTDVSSLLAPTGLEPSVV